MLLCPSGTGLFLFLFFRDRLVFSFVICLGLAVHVHFLFVYNFVYKFFSRIISSYCLKFTSVSYTSQTSSRHAAQTSERCITQQFRRQKPCPFDIMICRFGRLFPRLLPWIDRLTAPFLHTTENSLVNAAQASEHCITQYYIYIHLPWKLCPFLLWFACVVSIFPAFLSFTYCF